MNPHWLQGFARRPRRWRDRPDRAVGTEDKTGPDAGHAPQCRTRGRPWILPPDALVIQPGGPLEASAGHGARTPSRSAKTHGAGSEVRTAAGCRLRLSAAARTQAPERPRLAGGYKVSLFCRCELVKASATHHPPRQT
jgi:hypothetical protein